MIGNETGACNSRLSILKKKVDAFLNDSLNRVPGPEEANVYTSTLCTQMEK